ncbi:hypothetical protein EJB05_36369 [Eragrostis curvula]|uniref:J domain-containing protein n=1 Tax=Eragrostis curvula TaxID=38414 RepID=A0A5J9UAD8_9POAL|nr:hypothetical protein EJB05_36369 [Eragrostis curvula]
MDAARRERRHQRKAAAAAAAAAGMAPGGTGGAGGTAAAARAAYGDVFGGPPRFAAPFGAAPVDYAEVFGGVAATCSIPFLDLPPAAAVGGDDAFFACKGKGDYGEIFARFDFADFALPYEDVFGEPEPAPEPEREPEVEEIASSSGSSRSSIYKESSHLEDEAHILPQQYQNLDRAQHFNELKFSPISFHSDTASQQFVMSYNKATDRRPDDIIEMTTYTVEPSREFVVDSCNLSHGPETNHVSKIDNGTTANGDDEKNPSSSSMSARSPESDFAVEQKQQSPSWTPISASVSANENHTDSHSTRSGATPDYAFLRVSDGDSQTQPIKVQPSLRQQPKLLNKKESTAKRDINHVNHSTPTSFAPTISSNNAPQADKKADAVNPTSASAAMKEAMDFAEARLKAAKELLERKGDSFKLRKKPSHHRSTRSTEIKAPVLAEVDTFEEKLSVKNPLKDEENPEFSLSDKHKKLSASRLDHLDDSVKGVPPLEKPQKIDSCQTSSKLEKLGNWRSGDEYYELTGDVEKCRTGNAPAEDDKFKRTSPMTSLSNDKKSETEFSASDCDLERYEKLWEVNDGRDVGVKDVNLKENNTAPLDKDSASGILETSAENTAHREIRNLKLEGLVTQEKAKECHADDDCIELPSSMDTSTMMDSLKDMSGSLSEACSSGNHASDLRDLGNNSPTVSPVSGTSQEHTNSNLVLEVPCDDAIPCTSGSNEQLQETPEVSVYRGSNIKSLILEELEGSYVCDPVPRAPSTVEQDVETYGREKFSFTGESFLHNEETETKEVSSEKVEKVETEEKVAACAHREETVGDLNVEHPEESDISLQNNNLAGCEESDMLNVFEVASKLITRDLDQGMQGSSGYVDSRTEERTDGLTSDRKGKEAEETSLENIGRTSTEEESADDNQENQKSSESTKRGQSNVDANCDTTVDEIGSESISGIASDSTTKTTVTSTDEPTSSEKYTCMQHSVQKDESATSQTSKRSIPGVEETGDVFRGERELPSVKSTCEGKKSRVDEIEETYTSARISKAEHGPSPLEKNHSLPKSAEGTASVSAEAMKKEALRVQRAKERENRIRVESASEKDKGSSQRTEEAKESSKRLQKERELAEERESRKLEEEERERERKKDRLAVERATREAHERAFAEAREKAEKMAFERITAARQRASAEAREKEDRASAEARIKAERAAVERATAEARERAIEKAKAEKALAEARERRERYRSSFKERSTNQDLRQDTQYQRAASSNFTGNSYSNNKVVEVESALRHKARLERHQRTAERVTKALAEKNMRDLMAQREQAEKHRLSEFLDPEIKRWSNGKEGNLRALLSTLQYILGADSGWQPLPLTDLITAAAVKKAYRKATLCVHPDKLQQRGATIRQKYICEKVFDLLKDAWNKFTSEER